MIRSAVAEGSSSGNPRRIRRIPSLRSSLPRLTSRRNTQESRLKPTPTEIAKFNRQYKGLSVTYSDDFHDRFLIIDNVELHGLGSSINCLGRRVTSFTTRDAKEIAKLLVMLP